MAIAFGSAGARCLVGTASSSWSVAYPATVNAGDLLVLHIITNGGAVTTPSGWTAAYSETSLSNPKGGLFYKVAAGTEGGSNLSVTVGSTTGNAMIFTYTGVDAATPVDGTPTSASNATTTTSVVIPSITTTVADTMLVYADGLNSGSSTNTGPAGSTERVDHADIGGTGTKGGALYDEPFTGPGATGTRTITFPTRANWGAMMALMPDQGGTPTGVGTLIQRVVGIPADPTTEGRVQVKVADTVSARLICATDSALTTGVVNGSAATPDSDGYATLTVTGLTANTRYYYRVEMTDASDLVTVDDEPTIGRLRTAPSGQASFAFEFASCQNSTDPIVFPLITSRADDLFFHLGDMFYNDGSGTTLSNIRSKLEGKIQQANSAELYAQTNSAHCPGDHDVAENDTTNATDPTAWANYRTAKGQLFPDPDLYYTFVWGRVRFIVLDTMNFKGDPDAIDDASKSALGTTQKTWLKDQIDNATEPLIMIIQADPWVGAALTGDSGWFGFDTERTELAGHFFASGKNIIMCGGDMHALAADDGTNAPGGIAVFNAGPFGQTASQKGGPWSVGPYPASGTAFVTHYGRVVITDSGTSITAAFDGYDSTDTSVLSLSKTFDLTPPATTVSPTGIASAGTFGSPTVSSVLVSSPSGVASAGAFGTPSVTATLTASPSGIATAEALGAPTVSATLTVSPGGIAGAESVGAPTIGGNLNTFPPGIASAQAFGTPTISNPLPVNPAGIASAEAFGTPALALGAEVTPPGIASAESFGSPAVSALLTLSPTGVGSSEAFGSPTVQPILRVTQAGAIATAAAFGSPTVAAAGPGQTVSPTGIPSAGAFGSPFMTWARTVTPASIGSLQAFGTPRLLTVVVTHPATIPSSYGMGVPTIHSSLTAAPAGIAGQEAFGLPELERIVLEVQPTGLQSLEAFGVPRIRGGSQATPIEMFGAILKSRHSGSLQAPGISPQTPNRWEGSLD